jgi:O-antigen ligase
MLVSLLTAALAGFAWAGYVNYFLESRLMLFPFRVQLLDEFSLSTSLHYWIDLILLLGIVPLGMVLHGRRQAIWGAALGVVGYAVLILSRVRSAALLPLIGGFGLLLARREVRKYMLVATAVLAAGTLVFAVMFPDRILRFNLSHPSLAYRAEYYPFSWHVLKQHPLVGIGLRSPRTGFLCDYQECYPYRDGGWFAYGVQEWVTAENLYLTLLVGMGLPFFLLAIGSVVAGLRNVQRQCVATDRSAASDFHPMAILVVLVLCLGHAMVYDSFLFPQVCWYFFLFLGVGAGPRNLGVISNSRFQISEKNRQDEQDKEENVEF